VPPHAADPALEPPLHLVPEEPEPGPPLRLVPKEPEQAARAFGESRLLYAWREATPEEIREVVMKHADEIRRILDAN
jgi:hypothetical protein